MANTQQKLDELLELTRENNKLLNAQHRAKKLEAIKGVVRLVVIVVLLVLAYRFINPYIKNAQKIYESVSTQFQNISDTATKLQNTSEQIQNAGSGVTNFFSGFQDKFKELSQ